MAEHDVLGALDRIVREQRIALAAAARDEGLSAEDAVDCVHDALCTLLEMIVRGDAPALPAEHAPILFGIVRNAARNMRRRHHRSRPYDSVADEIPAEVPNADELVAHAEDCVRLQACIERLCASQRNVVMLRLLQERNGEDVARELGLTRARVDVLLYRAKASLAVCMMESR